MMVNICKDQGRADNTQPQSTFFIFDFSLSVAHILVALAVSCTQLKNIHTEKKFAIIACYQSTGDRCAIYMDDDALLETLRFSVR